MFLVFFEKVLHYCLELRQGIIYKSELCKIMAASGYPEPDDDKMLNQEAMAEVE